MKIQSLAGLRLGTTFWTAVIMTTTGAPLPAWSDALEDQGLAIAMEADRRDTGWGDSAGELIMILRNRHGQESRRQLRARSLEMEGDGDRSLVIFDDPRDVFGLPWVQFAEELVRQYLGKAADGVQRCTQFVRHVGDELACYPRKPVGQVENLTLARDHSSGFQPDPPSDTAYGSR